MNIRFKHNNTVITLEPNQSLTWCRGEPTEEGFSSTEISWYWDGNVLERNWENAGRDCDGYTSSHQEVYATEFDGERRPVWGKERSRVYDQFAESMNY